MYFTQQLYPASVSRAAPVHSWELKLSDVQSSHAGHVFYTDHGGLYPRNNFDVEL